MTNVAIIRQPASSGAAIEQDGVRVFQFDATVQEQHSIAATPTAHPLENGAEAADHIRVEPVQLVVTGIITNTPFVVSTTPLRDRDFVAWDSLERLLRGRRPLTVVTPVRVYEDMALVNVAANRDPTTGQQLAPTLTFRELVFVESMFVEVPPEVILAEAAASGSSDADAGRTQGETPTDGETERTTSWAAQAFDAFGG